MALHLSAAELQFASLFPNFRLCLITTKTKWQLQGGGLGGVHLSSDEITYTKTHLRAQAHTHTNSHPTDGCSSAHQHALTCWCCLAHLAAFLKGKYFKSSPFNKTRHTHTHTNTGLTTTIPEHPWSQNRIYVKLKGASLSMGLVQLPLATISATSGSSMLLHVWN